jgi:hypothetical protein
MAAGAAPAPEVKVDTEAATPWQRFQQKLHEIFAEREDHSGWHQ